MTYPPDADKLLSTLRTGAWLDRQEFPPLVYAVPGLIPEGSVLLVGAPKIGKSWLVLSIALAVAEGGRALGLEVPKRPVLYLALEDGHRRLQDRCRRLLAGASIPEPFQYITMVEPGRVADTIAVWAHWHQEPPPLVILDTLGKVLPPTQLGEDRYQRDYRVGTALKRIVDTYPGATLLINHHDRKANAEDFVDAVSGTHGLAGAADTIIVLSRDRQETAGLLKVTGRVRRAVQGRRRLGAGRPRPRRRPGEGPEGPSDDAGDRRRLRPPARRGAVRLRPPRGRAPRRRRRGPGPGPQTGHGVPEPCRRRRAAPAGRPGPLYPCYQCYLVTFRRRRDNR
jgi:hypothetical protein